MKKLVLIFCLIGLVFSSGILSADPTFTGPTGIATQPSAEIAGDSNLIISADGYFTKNKGTGKDTSYHIRALYGIGNVFEVGLGYIGGNNDTITIHGKYSSPIETFGFNWAFGAIYSDARPPRTDLRVTQLYTAGTKLFEDTRAGAPQLKATIGLNFTEFTGGFITGKESMFRYYAAGELFFDNGISAGFDVQSTNSSILQEGEPLWGFILRYPVNDKWKAHIGYTNWDNFKSADEGNAFIGADYSF
ncbi:MAG: hypothetical protein SNJ70_06975 [Armatimonadota bacterium]